MAVCDLKGIGYWAAPPGIGNFPNRGGDLQEVFLACGLYMAVVSIVGVCAAFNVLRVGVSQPVGLVVDCILTTGQPPATSRRKLNALIEIHLLVYTYNYIC